MDDQRVVEHAMKARAALVLARRSTPFHVDRRANEALDEVAGLLDDLVIEASGFTRDRIEA
jgi:hypothetical protein